MIQIITYDIKKYSEYINFDNINNEIYYHDNNNYKFLF